MSISIILLTLIFGLLFILYKRWAKVYDYWKERGIVHIKPYPFVGNMLDNLLKRKTMGEVFADITEKFKNEKYIGVYNFVTADLIINDVDYINTIFVKEFSHFMNRGPEMKDARFMDRHLFLMTGAEWKGVRTKMSPAFSSGKLKGMFPSMLESYDVTSKLIDSNLKDGNCLNLKDIIEMYIITVSATTIYGIDPKRLTDPNSEFKKIIDETSKLTFWKFVLLTLNVFFPRIALKFDISPMGAKIEKYFIDLVLNTFKERIDSGVAKDDIIQQLLQLKQYGQIEVSQWVKEDDDDFGSAEPTSISETIEITDSILVSQGFVFLMAGLDPLRATLGMLIVELSRHEDILNKLREDIDRCCKKHNGITWQAVKEMEYLDWCLSETLRLYPTAEFSARACVKDFTFPDGVTVEKGTRVLVPLIKYSTDANYFPEPEKFNPERFQNEPLPTIFMPFGYGPRMCIARRFAMQEMKTFIARLVLDYNISFNSKTTLPVQTDKWFFLRRNISPIFINFSKRQ